jgi:hypothetical protein
MCIDVILRIIIINTYLLFLLLKFTLLWLIIIIFLVLLKWQAGRVAAATQSNQTN